MKLDAQVIYGFAGAVLSQRFDDPVPTPKFHLDLWKLCTSVDPRIAIAAPRGHAKSTAITHTYTLAETLFRQSQFVVIVSDTEGQAKQFLADIKVELLENEQLREMFGVTELVKDTETEIVVKLVDGYMFKIIAKGSEQKVRGLKWRGKRPDLIIGDDLENDEIVMNKDRRDKFFRWLMGALIPCLSPTGKVRIVGTILHADSALERLLNDPRWTSRRYKAHNESFSKILWPERFPKSYWLQQQDSYKAQGLMDLYAQEFLNEPISAEDAYFRPSDMVDLTPEVDTGIPPTYSYYIGYDLAISKTTKADYSVFVVGRMNKDNVLQIVHVERKRMDSFEITQTFIKLALRYRPECFVGQKDQIEKAIGPFLTAEMQRRNVYFSLYKFPANTDKTVNARPIQARMRAGGIEFDKSADWYPVYEKEFLMFPRGRHDDQVDGTAMIGQVLDKVIVPDPKADLLARMREEYEEAEAARDESFEDLGMNIVCGY